MDGAPDLSFLSLRLQAFESELQRRLLGAGATTHSRSRYLKKSDNDADDVYESLYNMISLSMSSL